MDRRATFLLLTTLVALCSADDASEDTASGPSNRECSPSETWMADLNSVDVDNCPNGDRCSLVKGTEKKIKFTFTPRSAISSVRARVHGIIGDFPAPFAVPQADACQESGLECPLQPHQQVTYSAVLPIKSIYPQMSLLVKWELVDEKENVVACTIIPVKIVKGKS